MFDYKMQTVDGTLLLGILVLNAHQLRTIFGLFNFFGFERTDESFVDETRVWHKYQI